MDSTIYQNILDLDLLDGALCDSTTSACERHGITDLEGMGID
jgi:hypothetical protein